MSEGENFEVALARFEGKLDAWSMQQARHEDRLQAHATKLDGLQTQVTEVATNVQTLREKQRDDRRSAPQWPQVLSAIVPILALALVVLERMYGG